MAGPDFSEKTKKTAGERVGYCCSLCNTPTQGPHYDPEKVLSIGEAAHIRGRKPDAPRYDPNMSDAQRNHIDNALWLCRNCHGKIDKDDTLYTVDKLYQLRREAEERARKRQGLPDPLPALPLLSQLPQRWCHETTNDNTFVRRSAQSRSLTEWLDDGTVRIVSIVGIGGAGKTALVGHWLREEAVERRRAVRGLFYWSFYVNKDLDDFLTRLLHFLEEVEPTREFLLDRDEPLAVLERSFAWLPPLILVLDGLEVLQEAVSEGKAYGTFIDAKLRDFLQLVAYAGAPWLCVITSRFPITDLERTPGAKSLRLERLTPEEGSQVLAYNSVLGTDTDRRKITRYLEGHPLVLRVFAASIPRERRNTPRQHLLHIFHGAHPSEPFREKLERLLNFYSTSLADQQRAILQGLSIFRSPVPRSTLAIIAPVLVGERLSQYRETVALAADVNRLATSGLVVRDRRKSETVYACHPIVRDYFRRELLAEGEKRRAAVDILTSRPDELGIAGASTIEPLLLACEALLLSGETRGAFEIYRTRFEKGRVFLTKGLPREGKRFHDAVLAVSALPTMAGQGHDLDRAYFRNGAIYFDILLGEFADATDLIQEELTESGGSRAASPHLHAARLAFCQGDFASTVASADAAIDAKLQGGALPLVHAQALHLRLKALLAMAFYTEAKEASRQLDDLRGLLDSADGQILIHLGHLWLALHGQRNGGRRAAKEVRGLISTTDEDFLTLEARILVAHWHARERRQEGVAQDLLNTVYSHSVAQSYPYPMIWAQITRQYLAHRFGKACSADVLRQTVTLAEANRMQGLRLHALWLRRWIGGAIVGDDPNDHQIEYLIDRLGYIALERFFAPPGD